MRLVVDLLQAAITALFGIIVYVIGQLVLKIFIEPFNELWLEIGETSNALILNISIITNPGSEIIPDEKRRDAKESLRQQATFLVSKTHAVIWYHIPSLLQLLPSKNDIREAHRELIGISNQLYESQ